MKSKPAAAGSSRGTRKPPAGDERCDRGQRFGAGGEAGSPLRSPNPRSPPEAPLRPGSRRGSGHRHLTAPARPAPAPGSWGLAGKEAAPRASPAWGGCRRTGPLPPRSEEQGAHPSIAASPGSAFPALSTGPGVTGAAGGRLSPPGPWAPLFPASMHPWG